MDTYEKISDEELVKIVRTDKPDLYSELVNRYQDKLLRYTTRLIRYEALTQDVVQETFIKAFENLQGFNVHKKFSSWIYRIAHNEAINHAKKEKKGIKVFISEFLETALPAKDNIPKKYEKEKLAEEVRDCISQLDIKYSEPLALFFLDERSYEEISDILRIPIGTVGTRINRGKKMIKEICESKNLEI